MSEPVTASETPPSTAGGTAPPAGIDEVVDAHLTRLAGLPLAEHPDVYQEIHTGLRASLAEIDDA